MIERKSLYELISLAPVGISWYIVVYVHMRNVLRNFNINKCVVNDNLSEVDRVYLVDEYINISIFKKTYNINSNNSMDLCMILDMFYNSVDNYLLKIRLENFI